ncbi:MAG: hypothetical protein ACXV7D_02125, partial [Thermoanaerobaculia bacterium]
ANLKQRDLVIDAAGPFQQRNSALIDAAPRIGFDVIDVSDSADYTSMVYQHEPPVSSAGIRVLTACSSLSTISALLLKASGIEQPRRLSVYLLPASRYTANRGSTMSFLAGVQGRSRTIRFPRPIGARSGVTVKSVDAITLPPLFPSLSTIELIADCGQPIANALLPFAWFRTFAIRHIDRAMTIAHRIGEKHGVIGYEIVAATRRKQFVFTGERTFMLAVIPAVEAALAIASGKFAHRGVVPPTEHLDDAVFWDAVKREGIRVES